ncbi:hypothetical protein KZZ52_58205 [Dactylosporangium sp. AC04546]|uniref:hypothetical protein n=1 Tax=Dactylosporangium sp. AC04546 TaxID=2862460 RepID=UPI001EDF4584|nr:hypothetical protein [Dactylosporangium sp. AC04546]WVK83532.1 hypothetical protein KZZ52_58205 [Dactylosporangium sp. AC04546]
MTWYRLRGRLLLRRYRPLGITDATIARQIALLFTPDQAVRLGWPAETLREAFGSHRIHRFDWDAEVFIRTVHASSRRPGELARAGWHNLVGLARGDTTAVLRYLRDPRVDDVGFAVVYAGVKAPVDEFLALRQALRSAGADAEWVISHLNSIAREYWNHYRTTTAWPLLVGWVEHDGAALVAAGHNADVVLHRWRSWAVAANWSGDPHPALLEAAGITIEEAWALHQRGELPDREVLTTLAALRRDPAG